MVKTQGPFLLVIFQGNCKNRKSGSTKKLFKDESTSESYVELGKECTSRTWNSIPESEERDVSSSVLSEILYLWHINKERLEEEKWEQEQNFGFQKILKWDLQNRDL